MRSERGPLGVGLVALVLAVLVWSGIRPHDRFTWFMEVFPVLLGLPAVLLTHRRFPLTSLLWILLAIHACILMLGGKYTYAEVPIGNWVRDALGLARNHYDRVGHFAQGFVPAILAREILWRRSPLRGSRWLPFVVASICLAFSACYEFLEWGTALISGEGATAFLGTQGDVWDTQWDMFLALVGATTALLTLSALHERQLRVLTGRE